VITPPKVIPAPAETGTYTCAVFFGWGNVHWCACVCVSSSGGGGQPHVHRHCVCMM